MKTNKRQKGFTLVEILIVVVILGILAAIVIPQFSEASSQARESSVKSNLQMLRSQVELYKVQHGGDLPGAHADKTFAEALTESSTAAGADGTGYGPYMQSVPTNAYSESNSITVTTTAGAAPSVSTTAGWEWNSADGKIYCPYDTDTVTW